MKKLISIVLMLTVLLFVYVGCVSVSNFSSITDVKKNPERIAKVIIIYNRIKAVNSNGNTVLSYPTNYFKTTIGNKKLDKKSMQIIYIDPVLEKVTIDYRGYFGILGIPIPFTDKKRAKSIIFNQDFMSGHTYTLTIDENKQLLRKLNITYNITVKTGVKFDYFGE